MERCDKGFPPRLTMVFRRLLLPLIKPDTVWP